MWNTKYAASKASACGGSPSAQLGCCMCWRLFRVSSDPPGGGPLPPRGGGSLGCNHRLLLDFRGKRPVRGQQMKSGVPPCSHPQYLCLSVLSLPPSASVWSTQPSPVPHTPGCREGCIFSEYKELPEVQVWTPDSSEVWIQALY